MSVNLENCPPVTQPSEKANTPYPTEFENRSNIGLPLNLKGGTEYKIPNIIENKSIILNSIRNGIANIQASAKRVRTSIQACDTLI